MERNGGTVWQSIVIKGELRAKEDLTIEGQVEGTIQLDQGVLTIGPTGRVGAQVQAKVVNVMGRVKGSITGTETISIGKTATVDGDLVAPRVGIAEGASFRGQIDMQPTQIPAVPVGSRGKGTPRPPRPAGATGH